MLAKALKSYWIDSVNDSLPALTDDVRSNARACLQSIAGRAIFLSRKPGGSHRYQSAKSNAVTDVAITVRRVSRGQLYVLRNEHDNSQPLYEIAVLTNKGPAGAVADYLFEQIRLCTTNYSGEWLYTDLDGMAQSVFVHGCTIESDSEQANYASDGTNDWDYRLESYWQITHDITVPADL